VADGTSTDERLSAVEDELRELNRLVTPMAAAWARLGARLEAMLDNPVARWRAGK
jgi:hypothetical protein